MPLRPYAVGRDTDNQPLVFVARGSHAAYPLPCKSSICDTGQVFEDNRHDGGHEWPEEACSTDTCVIPFPSPARWRQSERNALDG